MEKRHLIMQKSPDTGQQLEKRHLIPLPLENIGNMGGFSDDYPLIIGKAAETE
ncbi:hypothetical protein [Paenibacillus phytohabitans]|uniref:hypothetical protein n=1 Tax=Paenibacillus TaxID=44249 RepID=UPI00149188D0|nr:hypothetical protein [Paenibacillus phytohabitans]